MLPGMDVTTTATGAGPINRDGSITIASRIDLAYNRPHPAGSLRAAAAAVWSVVATDRGPEHETETTVTAWPGLTEVVIVVRVRALILRPSRRRRLRAAAIAAAAVQLAPGVVPVVHVLERWRPLPG